MKVGARVATAAVKAFAVMLIQVERLTNRFGDVGVLRLLNAGTRRLGEYLKDRYFPQ